MQQRPYRIWDLTKQPLTIISGAVSSLSTTNSVFIMEANVSQIIESRAIFPNTLMNHTLGQVVADVGPLFLIHLIALFGNTLLCIAFLKNKHLRSVTNKFVLTLAFSDIVMSLICMPLSEGSLIAGEWIFGDLLCDIQGFLTHF